MRVKILDENICIECKNITCTYLDATIKESFYSLRSETTVCPTAVLTDGMASVQKKDGFLDKKECIECGLCVANCIKHNLSFENLSLEIDTFDGLSEQQYNALALSYLGRLFDFSANTNRNRSINFDGYIQTHSGDECFVEVDWTDDSLESCRRILGDFILYTEKSSVKCGLIVLRNIPKAGSRDVYELLHHIHNFPKLSEFRFYITTFAILRYLALNSSRKDYELSDLFYDPECPFEIYVTHMKENYGVEV